MLLFLQNLLPGAEPWWRGSNSLVGSTPVSDNPQVNSGRDRVVLFVVDFWQSVVVINGSLAQIPL